VGPTRLPSQQGPSNERYPSLVPVASQTHPSVCKIALPNVPTEEIVSPSVPHPPATVCLSSRIVSVGDLSKSSPTCKASSFVYISMRDSMKNIPIVHDAFPFFPPQKKKKRKKFLSLPFLPRVQQVAFLMRSGACRCIP